MPAFRDLLTPEEIARVVSYVQTLCQDKRWPRGEFNVPLAHTVEKAYPEDEVVLTSAVDTKGPGSVSNHLIFEKRLGARDQLEIDVPFGFMGREGQSWVGGLGDSSIVPSTHVFLNSMPSGTIVTASMSEKRRPLPCRRGALVPADRLPLGAEPPPAAGARDEPVRRLLRVDG
jgi:hypothetical protein